MHKISLKKKISKVLDFNEEDTKSANSFCIDIKTNMNRVLSAKEKQQNKKRINVKNKIVFFSKKKFKVMILCNNTYFGQEEILQDSIRSSQAKVLSQTCELYRIHKNVYI